MRTFSMVRGDADNENLWHVSCFAILGGWPVASPSVQLDIIQLDMLRNYIMASLNARRTLLRGAPSSRPLGSNGKPCYARRTRLGEM